MTRDWGLGKTQLIDGKLTMTYYLFFSSCRPLEFNTFKRTVFCVSLEAEKGLIQNDGCHHIPLGIRAGRRRRGY